jgi:hypothetical protein
MHTKDGLRPDTEGMSKTKLLLGAAGLLLFILGVRRSVHIDHPAGPAPSPAPEPGRDVTGD